MEPVLAADDLIRQAQTGDHRAFTTLLRGCDGRMRSLASGLMRNGAATDDVLQDAYLQAYRKVGSYEGNASFSTWLHTIVYRTCLDHLRRRDHRAEVGLEAVPEPASNVDHAEQIAAAGSVDQALRDLPPEQATAVILVDGQGCTYDEAATVLGVSDGTIASRLNRGRSALRESLQANTDEGGTP